MLSTKVINIENDRVDLQFVDGQKIKLPLAAIEGHIEIGSTVVIMLAVPGSEDAARQKLAKDILNEIIGE